MAYQRAGWHSGLIYQQTCPQCNTVVQYKDDKLDFRPWFADGFVYCPTCKKPLRHNENLAITSAPSEPAPAAEHTPNPAPAAENTAPCVNISTEQKKFCTQCGKALGAGDRFCSGCGTKV